MRLEINAFYRKFGIRKDSEVALPRLFPLESLELPFNYVTHYLPHNATTFGPENTDPILDVASRVFIQHIDRYSKEHGRLRYRPQGIPKRLQEFRRTHRKFLPVVKYDSVQGNKNNVLFVNYAPMDHAYIYRNNVFKGFWRWQNHLDTLTTHINEVAKVMPSWNHFIDIALPDQMPERKFLLQESGPEVSKLLLQKAFTTPEALTVRELWRWVGQAGDTFFDKIDKEALEHLYFFIHNDQRFMVVKASLLQSFVKTEDNKKGSIPPDQMQRRFLACLLRVRYAGIVEEDEETPAETPTPKTAPKDVTDDELDDLMSLFSIKKDTVPTLDVPDLKLPTVDNHTDKTITEADVTEAEVEEDEEEVEGEPLVDEIVRQANELRANRRITKATYDSIIRDARAFERIPDPFGSGKTLKEAMTITQEDVETVDPTVSHDRKTIVDKSMLKASTTKFTPTYVSKLFKKDIMNAVVSVQRRGTIVKDYRVEEVKDAMNNYQIHRVTLKPVNGKPKTVEIRIATPDKHGRMKVNDSLYCLRLQCADVPIRKVKPDRVALSSYIRKLFVQRVQRKSLDEGRHVMLTLVERGQDADDTSVEHCTLRNVFNKSHKDLPYYYQMMAGHFSEIILNREDGRYVLNFDYERQSHHFTEKELAYQNEAITLLGHRNKSLLGIAKDGMVYIHDGKQWTELNTLYHVLDIDISKVPIQHAVSKVSDKELPLGFILGYGMGLKKLVRKLNATVRIVPTGTRPNLTEDEYRLVFDDQTWVLTRKEPLPTLIFSGLAQYRQTTKRFLADDFNGKDVYYNILEDTGFSTRYLSEIDFIIQSWMDPITEELLTKMGEPTNILDLYIRAAELLMTRYSPEEMAPEFMRYRGYERVAGAVYKELHYAIKTRDRRDADGDTRIEFNPFAVWQTVLGDATTLAVREANPIQNLREQEGTTYRGEGGRSDQTMVAHTRRFLEGDKGTMSESSPDSGAVGIVGYLSPDANLADLRGHTRRFDEKTDGNAKLFSSSMLLSPSADQDDRIVI